MDRGAWQATVHGVTSARHDLQQNHNYKDQSSNEINRDKENNRKYQ